MMTAWAFIFGCILSLMFLGMLYGEKLSIVSLLEGRWLKPFPRTFGQLWNQLCMGMDVLLQFVIAHLSWVVAGVSGSVGLFIVAFLMFSGLADDATARHRDLQAPLLAGGVVDQIPPLVAQIPKTGMLLISSSRVSDQSEVVWQQPGGPYLVFKRPELDRSQIVTPRRPFLPDLAEIDLPADSRYIDRPIMDLSFRRIDARSPVYDDDRITSTKGRLEVASPLPQLIDRAVRRLRPDDWRMSFADMRRPDSRNQFSLPGELPDDLLGGLQEATAAELRELESGIRIVPGDTVAENQLRVEKLFPRESAGTEVTVEISVVNLSSQAVHGLLVREFLPRGTRVRRASPQPVLRDDVLTWLLDDLRPFDERTLRFTVQTSLSGNSGARLRFESATEVSAVTAVVSRTLVRNERLTPRNELPVLGDDRPARDADFSLDSELLLPIDLLTPDNPRTRGSVPVPRPQLSPQNDDRRLPDAPLARRPDVRFRIMEPLTPVTVGQAVEVNFVVENRGDAPAEGVGLRVILDEGLKHHTFASGNERREIVNGVRRLEPGEMRTIVLRMKADRPGEFVSRAEMIYEGTALSQATFRVAAEQRTP